MLQEVIVIASAVVVYSYYASAGIIDPNVSAAAAWWLNLYAIIYVLSSGVKLTLFGVRVPTVVGGAGLVGMLTCVSLYVFGGIDVLTPTLPYLDALVCFVVALQAFMIIDAHSETVTSEWHAQQMALHLAEKRGLGPQKVHLINPFPSTEVNLTQFGWDAFGMLKRSVDFKQLLTDALPGAVSLIEMKKDTTAKGPVRLKVTSAENKLSDEDLYKQKAMQVGSERVIYLA